MSSIKSLCVHTIEAIKSYLAQRGYYVYVVDKEYLGRYKDVPEIQVDFHYINAQVRIKTSPADWPAITVILDPHGEPPYKTFKIDMSSDDLDSTLLPILAKYNEQEKKEYEAETEWARERAERRQWRQELSRDD